MTTPTARLAENYSVPHNLMNFIVEFEQRVCVMNSWINEMKIWPGKAGRNESRKVFGKYVFESHFHERT
jgi:hypothetical protein